MNNSKIYKVLGIMTGTSIDGIDLSLIKTDGIDFVNIINEKSYQYSISDQKKIKKIIKYKPKKFDDLNKYFSNYDDLITNILKKFINKFLYQNYIQVEKIDIIGLSGQTVYHNPEKRISIQLGSADKISNYFKRPVISDFRTLDIYNGGQGAPIGSYYHRYLLKKINPKALLINLGGVANFSFLKNNVLISSDIGPANSISDDLTFKFYNKKFDKNGKYASLGNPNFNILENFKNDIFFSKKFPKSLDRNYFHKYLINLNNLDKNDAICTSINLTLVSLQKAISKKIFKNVNNIILTGGGRKNKYLYNQLIKKFNKIKFNKIDDFGYNGDLIESQMFAYISIRSLKKLIISTPLTTGVKKPITGGKLYKNN